MDFHRRSFMGFLAAIRRCPPYTDDSLEANLGDYWQSMKFSVPETGGATLSWDIFNPLGIGIVGLQDHANKPTTTTLGSCQFHNGITRSRLSGLRGRRQRWVEPALNSQQPDHAAAENLHVQRAHGV